MLKKSFIFVGMIGVVVLALASSGGGGKKKNTASLKSEFIPVRTLSGFTLKAGPHYTGSYIFSTQKNKNFVLYNSVITYEKGNVIYILPYQYKVNTSNKQKTNLSLLDLKFKLRK